MSGNGAKGTVEPIAIVGIGCRFADARGPAELWDLICSGKSTVRDVPEHRIELGYDIEHFHDPRLKLPGKISLPRAGFLDHPELFDPLAFGLSPRDAISMETQQRLMVEVTWDALEDAGIPPESIQGERVAVLIGHMAEDYTREQIALQGEDSYHRGLDVFVVGGMSRAVASGRISFLLGVTGPSFTLDTACSSSLFTTHLACQSLWTGESKMALAGGVNVFLTPEGNIALSRSGMLSPDGNCKAFDASADGFVRAEGAGMVVLRPLSDALAANDRIYSVIRGTGISADGRDGGHMMAPGRFGQAQAMRDAYARAGVDPSEIHYVETHGTGTVIGDPVELKALGDVMGPGRPADRPLLVASVKGTLGHAESASGVAGLIKASLSVHHRELPPQLHFSKPSPHIPWDELPIRVQTEHTPWPYDGPALAAVNSFGISGTNAHVVLESAPERESAPKRDHDRPYLLPITGHTPRALEEMAERYRDWLRGDASPALDDVAYTLGQRRSHRGQRLCVVGRTRDELCAELDTFLEAPDATGRIRGVADAGRVPGVAFVFPGQGSQWAGMGRQLLEEEPVFRASIEAWSEALANHVDWSLLRVLKTGDDALLERLEIVQPVLIAFSAALADLWTSYGGRPSMVIGQSLGEIAAAHIAGHLSREEAARLACERGAQVARARGRGSMGIVGLAARDVQAELDAATGRWQGRVEVAGINSPRNTIVSGDRDALEAILSLFNEREIFARPLNVDFASHCFQMEPLLHDFARAIGTVTPSEGTLPCYSTVTGERIDGSALTHEYWLRNLRAPVQLAAAVGQAISDGAEIFVEMSPHPALAQSLREVAEAAGKPISTLAPLRREHDESRTLRCALGEAFVRGAALDFGALHGEGDLVPTPLYAYQRERYWFGRRRRKHMRRRTHPLLGIAIQPSTDPAQRIYESTLDPDVVPYLADATLLGKAQITPALCIETALAVAASRALGGVLALRELELPGACPLPEDEIFVLQAILRESHARCELHLASRATDPDAKWTALLHGSIEACDESPRCEALDALKSACPERGDPAELYQELEASGIGLARSLRTIRELQLGDRQALGLVSLHHSVASESALYHAHPALLTGCLQLVSAALAHEGAPGALLLSRLEALHFDAELGSDLWCHVALREDANEADVVADVTLLDLDGTCVGRIAGLRGRPLAPEAHGTATPVFELAWAPLSELALDPEAPSHWLIVPEREDEGAAIAGALGELGARAELRSPEELAHEDLRDAAVAFVSSASGLSREGPDPIEAAFEELSASGALTRIAVVTRQLHAVANELPAPRIRDARRTAEGDAVARSEAGPPCLRIDAEAHTAPAAIARALQGPASEDRLALRGDAVYGARLVEAAIAHSGEDPRLESASSRPFEARLVPAGDLEPVALFEATRSAPGSGEVRIEIRAAALSFLDLVASFDPSGNTGLGRECAGIVTEVGPGVTEHRVGDEVFGFCEDAAASEQTVRAELLVSKPTDLSFERAAGLPLAFATAQLALDAAQLREGERVLIHSASSAIGLASLQLARARGAEIFASAGSPQRREALEAMGITRVASSRSLDFADAVKVWTDGRGVDVVLDARASNSAAESAALLAPGGRIVALSRPDPTRPRAIDLRDLDQGRTYTSIDLSRMLSEQPAEVGALLRETRDALAEGRIEPLPTTRFALEHAGRALRYMAQDRHVGKVVLMVVDRDDVEVRVLASAAENLAPRGRILVGGVNLSEQVVVAGWLAQHGAREINLQSADAPTAACIDALRVLDEQGTRIHVSSESPGKPLAGVVFVAAGSVLPDAELAPADDEGSVASELDAACGGHDLEFFAMLAPADAMLGLAGERGRSQPVFDAIARQRRARGLPATSIAIAHGSGTAGRRLGNACMKLLRESRDTLIAPSGLANPALPIDAALFRKLDLGAGQGSGLRDEILALRGDEQRERLVASVVEAVAGVLSLSASARKGLDLHLPLNRLGIDSLMGLELRVGLERDLGVEIPPTFFVEEPSVNDVALLLQSRIAPGEESRT